MTVQQAALEILREVNRPMSAKEISRIIVNRGLASSSARDPVMSFAQTLEKNIRGETYNEPTLVFILTQTGRQIGLPAWKNTDDTVRPSISATKGISLQIPVELLDKIHLAVQAKIAGSLDETLISILKMGLISLGPEIKQRLSRQLNDFDNLLESS